MTSFSPPLFLFSIGLSFPSSSIFTTCDLQPPPPPNFLTPFDRSTRWDHVCVSAFLMLPSSSFRTPFRTLEYGIPYSVVTR